MQEDAEDVDKDLEDVKNAEKYLEDEEGTYVYFSHNTYICHAKLFALDCNVLRKQSLKTDEKLFLINVQKNKKRFFCPVLDSLQYQVKVSLTSSVADKSLTLGIHFCIFYILLLYSPFTNNTQNHFFSHNPPIFSRLGTGMQNNISMAWLKVILGVFQKFYKYSTCNGTYSFRVGILEGTGLLKRGESNGKQLAIEDVHRASDPPHRRHTHCTHATSLWLCKEMGFPPRLNGQRFRRTHLLALIVSEHRLLFGRLYSTSQVSQQQYYHSYHPVPLKEFTLILHPSNPRQSY